MKDERGLAEVAEGFGINEAKMVTFGGANSRTGELITVIGGPGTGKSFAIKRIVAADFTLINSDKILQMFADVRMFHKKNMIGKFQRARFDDVGKIDLKDPEVTRDFYNLLRGTAKGVMNKILRAFSTRDPKDLPNLLIDTTGQNVKKLVDIVKYGKEVGYRTTLVYVFVDKKVAWDRNVARSRSVPLDQFDKMHEIIPAVYKSTMKMFDRVWSVESETDLVWSKDKDGVVTKPNSDRVKRVK